MESRLGPFPFEVGLKGLQQPVHLLFHLRTAQSRIRSRGGRRIPETSSDLPQPDMGFPEVRHFDPEPLHHPQLQLAQLACLRRVTRQRPQRLCDRLKLFIALQPAPIEWLAALAIYRVTDSNANLRFYLYQFLIPLPTFG